jgi:hypothetical protein
MPELNDLLRIETAADGGVRFELKLGDERLSFSSPEPPTPDNLLRFELQIRLREWRRQRKAPRWFGLEVCEELRALPWDVELQDALDHDPIAWLVPRAVVRREPLPIDELRLLLSVWPDPSLPGLKRELETLAVLGDRIHTQVVLSPTGEYLQQRLEAAKPSLVHLAPTVASLDGRGAIGYRDEASGELRGIPSESLAGWLPAETRLVVINTCHATTVAQELTGATGVVTVAWANVVSDERALAFALFFYEQLLRGTSPADAILMFSDQAVGSLPGMHRDLGWPRSEYSLNPVVFVPDWASLSLELVAPAGRVETPRGRGPSYAVPITRGGKSDDGTRGDRRVDAIQIEVLKAINPALLVNGRYPVSVLRFMCPQEIPSAVVEVICDAGLGVSRVRRMVRLVAGMTPLDVSDFEFPVLYELLRLGVKRRPINFRVRLLDDGDVLAEDTKSSLWMGRDEWIDSKDTFEFIPAFIDPDLPAVKDLWTRAKERVEALAKRQDLDGESASAEARVDPYVEALYLTVRDFAPKLRYIQPPPQRVGARGGRVLGQRVRSPALVLSDGRGTCHDLSLLFAACMEHIRLYPLVVLIKGHTFTGYWRSLAAYREFWGNRTPWLVPDVRDLKRLVADKKVRLLEATDVTDPKGRRVEFDEACEHGLSNLDDERTFDVAIDVRASRESVDTLESE